eukprot:TRINITY_DN91629_c0_g1_i1.p1 TRINITY_DN91629_c0_g1~~TRINITY_DN91629_c0_g1_i1.p1  ORF type:complete len:938 (+),score=269.63 TRINITY_DN91629_c0_g1_i1:148-2961(+)
MAWCCLEFLSQGAVRCTIVCVFIIDFLVCLGSFIVARADAKERGDPDKFAASDNDTLVLFGVRCIVFPLVAWAAYRQYLRTAAKSPLRQLESDNLNSTVLGSSPVASASDPTSLRVPLAAGAGAATSPASSTVPTDARSAEKMAFEMKRDHALQMKKAEKHKSIIMAVLFAISTALSMYNGLKCVGFDYDPSIMGLQGTLLATVMFLINIEYFMLVDYLNKAVKEKGELIPALHMHPVFFETGLKCHGCDICHERIKGPHYIAYRCRTCDFDLCPRCYRKKDKASAKGMGSLSIRQNGDQVTTWSYFKRICELSMECKFTTAGALICLLCSKGLFILAPSIQGSIFDGVQTYLEDPDGGGRQDFERAMTLYLIINVLQGAFGGGQSLCQELVNRVLQCSVRMKLFKSILGMDIAFFDAMHTGQLTSRLNNDVNQMLSPLNILLNDLLANLLLLFGGMFAAFYTNWKLSILALTIVPPISYSYRVYAQWARGVNRSIYAAYGDANSTATEAIQNIRTVRGFSTESHEKEKYEDAIDTGLSHGKKNAYVAGSVNAFTTYLNLGTAVLIMWYGGMLVIDSKGEAMSIGELITFQLYWNMMNTAFISLGNVFNELIRASSAAERVLSLMEAKPDTGPPRQLREIKREEITGNLELRAVKFYYLTRPENLVLKGVDLTMKVGTTTALVGKSGGGKSTCVHLLMGFYQPTEGGIFLDGVNLASLDSRSVRKCCGLVAQDTQLFATSIKDNLIYGLGRDCSHDEVVEACKAANAHEFIMETEEQYETRVGEKGAMLSGGQRQRLAIARCFLRRPRLLFLDEATSALDAENEAIVQGAIDRLLKESGCTVVLIAHRLSTVINADQIVVVHKGTLKEKGTHEQLMNVKGIYSQLVQRQLSRSADAIMDQAKQKKGAAPKTVQSEIDDLMEELEAQGALADETAHGA